STQPLEPYPCGCPWQASGGILDLVGQHARLTGGQDLEGIPLDPRGQWTAEDQAGSSVVIRRAQDYRGSPPYSLPAFGSGSSHTTSPESGTNALSIHNSATLTPPPPPYSPPNPRPPP